MKPIFELSDFQIMYSPDTRWEPMFYQTKMIATRANEIINKIIESWPEVYSVKNGVLWGLTQTSYDTHKARLAFVEELPKEECKHEPSSMSSFKMAVDRFNNRFYKHFNTCQYCGIELVAEWKEKK